MAAIGKLVRRNLLVYFRDRAGVFFSFLSVIIIIGLYALFLGDMQVMAVEEAAGKVPGIRFMIDSWIMAGLLAVNTITVSLGALAIMVRDQDKKVLRDFLTAPVKRSAIVLSYILSTFIVTTILSLAGLILMEGYILLFGGDLLSAVVLLKVVGVLLLSILNAVALMFFMTTFVRSLSAFSTLSTIIGTLIGFIAGVYVPISLMPTAVQYATMLFPTTHTAALLRQLFMEVPLAEVFAHAPAEAAEEYREAYGVVFKLNGEIITPEATLLYLAGLTVVLIALSVLRVRRMRLQ